MAAGGYESWFVSARDPASPRALWIRHTRHRPQQGRESAALWCTVVDRDGDQPPVVITDPRGGTRTVRHAALASVELTVRRPGHGGLTLSSRRGAYEYGTREPMPGITPRPLPES